MAVSGKELNRREKSFRCHWLSWNDTLIRLALVLNQRIPFYLHGSTVLFDSTSRIG